MRRLASEEVDDRNAMIRAIGVPAKVSGSRKPMPKMTIARHLSFLNMYGFSADAIERIVTRPPSILRYAWKRTDGILRALQRYGFSKAQIIKMVTVAHGVLCLSPRQLQENLRDCEAMGMRRATIIRRATVSPALLCHAKKRRESVWRALAGFGFRFGDITEVVSAYPPVIGCDPKKVRARLRFPLKRGLSAREVRGIVLRFPAFLGSREERTGESFDVFRVIGYDVRENPSRLITAPSLLRGRHVWLERHRKDRWVMRDIFVTHEEFERRFGVTRAQLIALDPGPEAFRPPLRPVLRD